MTSPKIAIVWRGDREARRNATPANIAFIASLRSSPRSTFMQSRPFMTRVCR